MKDHLEASIFGDHEDLDHEDLDHGVDGVDGVDDAASVETHDPALGTAPAPPSSRRDLRAQELAGRRARAVVPDERHPVTCRAADRLSCAVSW